MPTPAIGVGTKVTLSYGAVGASGGSTVAPPHGNLRWRAATHITWGGSTLVFWRGIT